MSKTLNLIANAYSAFNHRDVDGALALMTDTVSWPKASEGGRVVGKDDIRAYWTRQWNEFDPNVEPLEFTELGNDQVRVTVHQLVKSLSGEILSDSKVTHTFTISNGLIERTDVEGDANNNSSVAFARA